MGSRVGVGEGRARALVLVPAVIAVSLALAPSALARTTTVQFHYDGTTGSNGAPQYWTVPTQVYSAKFEVYGAAGAKPDGAAAAGRGGEVSATLKLTPGEVLQINVGGAPLGIAGDAGWNGGGSGGGIGPSPSDYLAAFGGGGGGASDVRSSPYGKHDRLLVGGGGGGSSGDGTYGQTGGAGGAGGGSSGAGGGASGNCTFSTTYIRGGNPAGGTQAAGGAGGSCDGGGHAGVLADGGAGADGVYNGWNSGAGGGGGGGYYGGGGGGAGSPGSYFCFAAVQSGAISLVQGGPGSDFCSTPLPAGGAGGAGGSAHGPKGARFRTGARNGSGLVEISYTPNCSGGGAACITTLSAPVDAAATAGVRSATVSFGAPKHGNGISGYEVSVSPGGATVHAKNSPVVIKDLKDGTGYTFKVRAENEIGASPAAAVHATPADVPAAPSGVAAVAGDNGVAVVAFSAPASPYSAIKHYTVTASAVGSAALSATAAGLAAIGTGSPITVTGLNDGVAYTFRVTATNGVGVGASSASSNPVTPVGLPTPPVNAVAIAGNEQATVSFAASDPDGEPIAQYAVSASPGDETATGSGAPITVTGLSPGTSYTFTVTATSAFGTSKPSNPSAAVTVFGLPGAPTGVSGTGGNAAATISFSAAPANGSPITQYTATASPGGATGTGSASPIKVGSLTNGTAYTFTVVATNAAGTGPPSAVSAALTPLWVPGAPTDVVASNFNTSTIEVTFSAPASDGGSAIEGYKVTGTSSDGGATASGTTTDTSAFIKGATSGDTYTFTVTAMNTVGSGPASAASNAVTAGS